MRRRFKQCKNNQRFENKDAFFYSTSVIFYTKPLASVYCFELGS